MVNNNFILNTENPLAPFLCETAFYFEGTYNDRLIDSLHLGAYAVFRTYDFHQGEVLPSPVFYVSAAQEVVCRESWECSYRTKLFVPGHCDNVLLECEMENGEVDCFTLHEKKLLSPSLSLQERLA